MYRPDGLTATLLMRLSSVPMSNSSLHVLMLMNLMIPSWLKTPSTWTKTETVTTQRAHDFILASKRANEFKASVVHQQCLTNLSCLGWSAALKWWRQWQSHKGQFFVFEHLALHHTCQTKAVVVVSKCRNAELCPPDLIHHQNFPTETPAAWPLSLLPEAEVFSSVSSILNSKRATFWICLRPPAFCHLWNYFFFCKVWHRTESLWRSLWQTMNLSALAWDKLLKKGAAIFTSRTVWT